MVGDFRHVRAGVGGRPGRSQPVSRTAGRPGAEKQLALTAERKLDEILGDMESSAAIRAALSQFQEGAADPRPRGPDCRVEPRLPLDKPARITRLLEHSSGAIDRMGEPLAGRLRNVSRQGFGLVHDERLERGLVLLEIDFNRGEPLQLIGGVLWCELQDSGCYFSGGKILEVVSPSDAQAAQRHRPTRLIWQALADTDGLAQDRGCRLSSARDHDHAKTATEIAPVTIQFASLSATPDGARGPRTEGKTTDGAPLPEAGP